MGKSIRVIDGGGNGFRRADIFSDKPLEVCNFVCTGDQIPFSPDGLVNFACAELPPNTSGVSYAMAGEIKDGVVIKSPQIHMLEGADLAKLTEERIGRRIFKINVLVSNDMDGAAMGMKALLPLDENYFLAVTWSSGIGVRVFKDGKIIARGEGGHIPLDPSSFAPMCGCGLRGCAESIIGGESVRRRVIATLDAVKPVISENVAGMHPCAILDQAYKRGDDWAVGIYKLVACGMGTFLAIYQTIFHVPLIVWKGSFAMKALREMESMIREYMRRRMMNFEWETGVKFILSPRPYFDSLIGAAELFRRTFT